MEVLIMWALTYLYEGCEGNDPYAQTMCVSEDREKIVAELKHLVEVDTTDNEEDEWDDSECNYKVVTEFNGISVGLQHKKKCNLYASYTISKVLVF